MHPKQVFYLHERFFLLWAKLNSAIKCKLQPHQALLQVELEAEIGRKSRKNRKNR
ncbi:hypothetical protein J2X36_004528 [Methylobacterium sp. BE186]|uniref:hypothetical protein n=1 Tax=Methylobacterium sp. BE186 TaxID=2817715 RepID=UPI00285CDC40|nr:hypothetical protein [Methylobacterium sp. BE186]MDR7039750.1 hypothetical protein [Methylobacterium sp. BE186]